MVKLKKRKGAGLHADGKVLSLADHLLGDVVELTTTLSGDATARDLVTSRALLNNLHGLELDEDPAEETTSSKAVMVGADTLALKTTVDKTEVADTTGAEVDATSDGGSADVVPVRVDGGELLGAAGLAVLSPCRGDHLAAGLEVLCVSSDELGSADVLHADTIATTIGDAHERRDHDGGLLLNGLSLGSGFSLHFLLTLNLLLGGGCSCCFFCGHCVATH